MNHELQTHTLGLLLLCFRFDMLHHEQGCLICNIRYNFEYLHQLPISGAFLKAWIYPVTVGGSKYLEAMLGTHSLHFKESSQTVSNLGLCYSSETWKVLCSYCNYHSTQRSRKCHKQGPFQWLQERPPKLLAKKCRLSTNLKQHKQLSWEKKNWYFCSRENVSFLLGN